MNHILLTLLGTVLLARHKRDSSGFQEAIIPVREHEIMK